MVCIETLELEFEDYGHITNSYLVWDDNSKEGVVIDPANHSEKIVHLIEEKQVELKYILLTHGHRDHTNAMEKLIKKYNVKVCVSKDEKNMLEGRIYDCSPVFDMLQVPYNEEYFRYLEDGEEIKLNKFTLKTIFTPGHTKGSACYFLLNENVMFTGDTLFYNTFGRCDLPSSSIYDMSNSLSKLYSKYSNVKIMPGHGKVNVNINETKEIVKVILNNRKNH